MKVLCEKCSNDLTKVVSDKFRTFQTGRIRCVKCRKRIKRFISTLDIYIYNFGNILVFLLAILAIRGYSLLNLDKSYTVLFIVLLVGMVAFIKYVFSSLAAYIFNKAPLKKAWADVQIPDTKKYSPKKVRIIYTCFYVVLLFLMFSKKWFTYFGLSVFILFYLFNIFKAYKYEKNYYENVYLKNNLSDKDEEE